MKRCSVTSRLQDDGRWLVSCTCGDGLERPVVKHDADLWRRDHYRPQPVPVPEPEDW